MNKELLQKNARQVVDRSILAADESSGTIQKRFDKIGLKAEPETNKAYRLLFFNTPRIEEHISGVILYDETFRQKDNNGTPIPVLLEQKGIVPGIKVDKGTVVIPGLGEDAFTQGLDDLGKRIKEYASLRAGFAKWRALIKIRDGFPKDATIDRNAHDLSLYAAICQENGVVPIVEPEVDMEGTHSMADSQRVTDKVLNAVFKRLGEYNVEFSGMILKPNMITPNKKELERATPREVAEVTLRALRNNVHPDVAGIAFLSGGQSPEMATVNLNAINLMRDVKSEPWRMTASYGRAFQDEARETWYGKTENIPLAQTVFLSRAEKVHKASKGQL